MRTTDGHDDHDGRDPGCNGRPDDGCDTITGRDHRLSSMTREERASLDARTHDHGGAYLPSCSTCQHDTEGEA